MTSFGMSLGRTRIEQQSLKALGLGSAPVSALLGRLHAAVSATVPDFVLTSGAAEYESLFGPWLRGRNPSWQ